MAVLPAVVALGLMAYLPGRFLLRLLTPGGMTKLGAGRLLLELLLGNAAVALVGLPLAELGVFSLPAVLAALILVGGVAAALTRGRAVPAYGAADAVGLAAAVAVLVCLMPPFDTTLYGYDSSVYLASGRSLERHGGLAFVDPTIEAMPMAARARFFPRYDPQVDGPPFLRVPGGLLLTSLDHPVVLPAFHHLLAVWVGLARAISGDAAAAAPAVYFGSLALWAVVSFAYGLAGAACAGLAGVLLLLSAPEHWYSRFLMPEVPSQYFLWAGLAAAASVDGPGWLGVAAGLGLGVAGLMRVDGLAHTIAALALWKTLAPSRTWPAARGFLPAFAAVAAYAVAHQILFPTHYYAEVASLLGAGLSRLAPRFLGSVLGLAGVLAVRRRETGRLRGAALRLVAAVFFAVYAVATLWTTRPDPAAALEWLELYAGWPVLLAAIGGAAVWWRRSALPAHRFALLLGAVVLLQLAYDARVTPAPLWAVRRFVPIVLPVLYIAAVLALTAIARGRRWRLAVGLAILVAGAAWRTSLTYGAGRILRTSGEHAQALAALLPPGAVAVFDPAFALETQLHIALWGLADIPGYLLAADMEEPLRELRDVLPQRPLYWVGAAPARAGSAVDRMAEPMGIYRYGEITRRLDWYDTRENLGQRDVTVWLYRFRPADPARALH